jgi:hypothetical protein
MSWTDLDLCLSKAVCGDKILPEKSGRKLTMCSVTLQTASVAAFQLIQFLPMMVLFAFFE